MQDVLRRIQELNLDIAGLRMETTAISASGQPEVEYVVVKLYEVVAALAREVALMAREDTARQP